MLKRTLSLGSFLDRGQRHAVEVEVNVTDKPSGAALSITGSVWLPSRRDIIAGGQLQDSLLDYLTEPAYKRSDVDRLLAIWQRWHLNDMRAGCEHQRAEGWDKRPLFEDKPLNAYVEHPDGHHGWNMLVWVPESRGGLLSKPCDTCGYRYGTRWLHETLPFDVVENLRVWPLMPSLSHMLAVTSGTTEDEVAASPFVVSCLNCTMTMWSVSASAVVDHDGSILCRDCAGMPKPEEAPQAEEPQAE